MQGYQPRPQGFSLKKWVKGKSPGDEVGRAISQYQVHGKNTGA